MENKRKDKKKRKILVIILFLVAISIVTGYGVYSYYSTSGTFSSDGVNIKITPFDPEITDGNGEALTSNYDFLGNGGTMTLDCITNHEDGSESPTVEIEDNQAQCVGYLTVENRGGSPIEIGLVDNSFSVSFTGIGEGEASASTISFESMGGTSDDNGNGLYEISYGASATFQVSAIITHGSNIEEVVTEPVIGSSFNVSATFKLKALQVLNNY